MTIAISRRQIMFNTVSGLLIILTSVIMMCFYLHSENRNHLEKIMLKETPLSKTPYDKLSCPIPSKTLRSKTYTPTLLYFKSPRRDSLIEQIAGKYFLVQQLNPNELFVNGTYTYSERDELLTNIDMVYSEYDLTKIFLQKNNKGHGKNAKADDRLCPNILKNVFSTHAKISHKENLDYFLKAKSYYIKTYNLSDQAECKIFFFKSKKILLQTQKSKKLPNEFSYLVKFGNDIQKGSGVKL